MTRRAAELDGFGRVARLEEVPPQGLLGVVTPAGDRLCLVNDGGVIRAVSDTCPHQDFPLSDGTLLPGGVIECAWHGARFDLATGAVCKPPAGDPLPVYEAVVVDGEIWVRT